MGVVASILYISLLTFLIVWCFGLFEIDFTYNNYCGCKGFNLWKTIDSSYDLLFQHKLQECKKCGRQRVYHQGDVGSTFTYEPEKNFRNRL